MKVEIENAFVENSFSHSGKHFWCTFGEPPKWNQNSKSFFDLVNISGKLSL